MSGEDAGKPKPAKSEDAFFETTDFSVSADTDRPDPNEITIKANGTIRAEWFQSQGGQLGSSSVGDSAVLPTDIPGFSVERELGRGAFGVVYAAHDQMLERKVAIKKPLISDPLHRQQYIDEARKAVKLEHPGIVPIYHVGTTTGGEPFVVQKLIEGSSLRGLMKSNDGRLSTIQIVSIMRQVCLAVDAAHAAGIVHRDLKPENLLVEPDGRVYVADFGLAILEDDEQVGKGREIAGTPFYMSPEQFAGRNEWLDGRSDIWALGVIFYELLSAKTPFSGRTLSELKDEVRNRDPRPIHQRDPNIPPAFDALFRKCCAKQVADRFASVHELLAELDAICKSLMIDPLEWESHSRIGSASSPLSRGGPYFDTSRDSLSGRGASTHRNLSSTTRSSMNSSIFREPRLIWSLVGPMLTTVLTLMALVFGAWYWKLGPFAMAPTVLSTTSIDGGSLPIDPSTLKNDPVDSKQASILTVPDKPFVVSIKGDGTHESIAMAIADSAAGETITIRAGTYRGSFIVDRSLNIVGEGEVRCIAIDKSCMEVRADSKVVVENVHFECQTDERNTIDLFGGQLTLKDCEVFASSPHSYNCVRARSNSVFVADQCTFQSMEHAAINGDVDATIVIRDSKISFPGNVDFGLKRIGIQATGAKGLVQNCVFVGPCMAGIDWNDSPDQELTIEACQFDNCEVGIQAKNCGMVRIAGTDVQPCELKSTRFGINLVGSKADLKSVRVVSTGEKDKVGLQFTKDSRVKCSSCYVEGMQCGVLVNQSELIIVDSLEVHDTSFSGMLVDESNVEAKNVRLLGVGEFGLVVLSTNTHVDVESLTVAASESSDQKITPAIYATSGRIKFDQAEFRNCLCAICVDPDREIIEFVGYPKKSILAELLKTTKRTDQPLPVINGDRMTLADCEVIWSFAGTGACKIKEILTSIPPESRAPRILYPEKLELDSSDYSDFSVVTRSGRK